MERDTGTFVLIPGAWLLTFRTIDTGRRPMVSAPDQLVALLDEGVTRP
jgi:hypothetical protein